MVGGDSMSSYSLVASQLSSSADTIEEHLNTIREKKSSFDSIWSGSAHDKLTGDLITAVTNGSKQVSNMRKLATSLNNLDAYKTKKEERDSLSSRLSSTPNTEENVPIISSLKHQISNLDNDLSLLKTRISNSISGITGISKQFEVISFDAEELAASLQPEEEKTSSQESTTATYMVKDSNSNPDFSNLDAWIYKNPYSRSNTGQCTWFSWGKFYETYGYSPGFTGNGCDCVNQLIKKNGDKFYLSDTPVAGSVFSVLARPGHPYGHTGMVIAVNGDTITIQDGNYNGHDDSFEVAQTDWGTYNITLSDFKTKYSNRVVFANPITTT